MIRKREVAKAILAPMLRWTPLEDPQPGYSIVLGVPWDLRDLLEVNLRFVRRQDLSDLRDLHVVFDRTAQPGAEEFVARMRGEFPDLPLDFRFHPPAAGWVTRRVNQSKFYASLNWTQGLAACRTRYAILHDFDLYPVDRDYFAAIADALAANQWHFGGAEITRFNGLTEDDGIIGTWSLGMDVQWLRGRHHPINCYHSTAIVNGREVDVDPFSKLEASTPRRGLVPRLGRHSYAHVTNLCSTYLRFTGGQKVDIAWRLHYLWYLESLSGRPERLGQVTEAMRQSRTASFEIDGRSFDLAGTDATCSNVLRTDLTRMESVLFGSPREEVASYLDEFGSFLRRIVA